MNTHQDDPQLDALRASWLATGPRSGVPEDLHALVRRRVRRETTQQWRSLSIDLLLTIAAFFAAYWLEGPRSSAPLERTAHVVLWSLAVLHAAVVWGTSLWLRHKTWRPLTESTSAYLALTRRRADRLRRGARLGALLLAVECLAAWVAAFHPTTAGPVARDVAYVMSGLAVVLTPMLVWRWRRSVAQLRWLSELTGDSERHAD